MPSWRAHRSITLAALRKLGDTLPREVVEGVLEGIVDPDRAPDTRVKLRFSMRGRVRFYVGQASHHSFSRDLVEYYFNLSLYYLRRGDEWKAGFMLGRSLHYVQDESLSRRRYLVLDVHDAEEKAMSNLATTPQQVEELCKNTSVSEKNRSPRAMEALCIALKRSGDILKSFIEESKKPIDVQQLKKRIADIRLAKTLIALSSLLPILFNPLLIVATLLVLCVVYCFRPKTYYEAMRAGIMVLKPIGVETAY